MDKNDFYANKLKLELEFNRQVKLLEKLFHLWDEGQNTLSVREYEKWKVENIYWHNGKVYCAHTKKEY